MNTFKGHHFTGILILWAVRGIANAVSVIENFRKCWLSAV